MEGFRISSLHCRESLCVQIGDDALSGRTNPGRIPDWAHSVPVVGWAERKLSGNVSRESIQIQDDGAVPAGRGPTGRIPDFCATAQWSEAVAQTFFLCYCPFSVLLGRL